MKSKFKVGDRVRYKPRGSRTWTEELIVKEVFTDMPGVRILAVRVDGLANIEAAEQLFKLAK